jgi:lipid-A-disaccharide synthase
MRSMASSAPTPVRFVGIGGPGMIEAGLEPLGDAARIGVTGFLEVLGSLGDIWRAFRSARAVLKDRDDRPDLVILIDYPDFNLRLARQARRFGVPVLYFVSPQIWAWRHSRIQLIAKRVDRMLIILPFEEEIYRRAGIPVEFVGHPLVDTVRSEKTREQVLRPLGLDPRLPTIALLPGSRSNEVRALLPPLIAAARLLKEEFVDLQFVLPVAPTLDRRDVEDLVAKASASSRDRMRGGYASPRPARNDPSPKPVLVEGGYYDLVAATDAAVVASGTATLETALLGIPMVIVYRVSRLTYALARLVSEVPHIGMANLITGERVVPELIQEECRPERIAAEMRAILTDPGLADRMRRSLGAVRDRLGAPGAIERAARAAWSMMRHAGEAEE